MTGPPCGWVQLAAGSDSLQPTTEREAARRCVVEARLEGAAQQAMRADVLERIDAHPDVLDRTCRPGHLTGSAIVVAADADEVLVLHHTKLRRWLQPGGHADGDGNLAHVAWREASEETGIEGLVVVAPAVHLDVHEVRPPAEDPHLHLDLRYLVLAPQEAAAAGNHESTALRWVGVDELPGLGADPGLIDLAGRGLEVRRQLS